MQVPLEIKRARYIEAMKAFSKIVGLDPAETTFPLVLSGDRIQFATVVSNEDGGKVLSFKHHGAGNLASILTASGTIEVVD